MKALTLWQPWAWAIFHGKPLENRSWWTAYRGPLLIHAGKTFDYDGAKWIWDNREKLGISWPVMPSVSDFPRSAFIGKVQMVACVKKHDSPWFFGPYGHVYKEPIEFNEPIRAKGKQGLWEWNDGTDNDEQGYVTTQQSPKMQNLRLFGSRLPSVH